MRRRGSRLSSRDVGNIDIWNESAVPGTMVHCHQVAETSQAINGENNTLHASGE
jgi:hypothetical protein